MTAQGALADAATADGRKYIRAGFGATDEDDLLYALGWPNMVWLEPGDAKPRELATVDKFSSKHVFVAGPRKEGVARRNLRQIWSLRQDKAHCLEAIQNSAPIDDTERERLFDFVVREPFGFVTTLILEALYSSRAVLDALVPRIEALTDEDWMIGMFESFGGGCLRAVHFLLLRTDETHAREMRMRLENVWDDVAEKNRADSRAAKALDLALHGKAGVARSGGGYDTLFRNELELVPNDPDFVRSHALAFIPAMKSRNRSFVSARLAFLGGDDVLAAIAANVKNIHSSHREELAVGLSRCARPIVGDIMAALGTPTAKRWLKARAPKKKP